MRDDAYSSAVHAKICPVTRISCSFHLNRLQVQQEKSLSLKFFAKESHKTVLPATSSSLKFMFCLHLRCIPLGGGSKLVVGRIWQCTAPLSGLPRAGNCQRASRSLKGEALGLSETTGRAMLLSLQSRQKVESFVRGQRRC